MVFHLAVHICICAVSSTCRLRAMAKNRKWHLTNSTKSQWHYNVQRFILGWEFVIQTDWLWTEVQDIWKSNSIGYPYNNSEKFDDSEFERNI